MEALWLIRHGETEWAATGRHTGRTDIELTPRGIEDARDLGRRLAQAHPEPFARVMSSPLRRALDTCRLAGHGEGVVIDPDLMEWDYGDAEGRTRAELGAETPGWNLWEHGVRGGETVEAVGARAEAVIARAASVGGDVAVFAHGHVLRILAARWLGLPPTAARRLLLDTAAYGVLLEGPDGRVLHRWNVR